MNGPLPERTVSATGEIIFMSFESCFGDNSIYGGDQRGSTPAKVSSHTERSALNIVGFLGSSCSR
jgi:hypothetical protein